MATLEKFDCVSKKLLRRHKYAKILKISLNKLQIFDQNYGRNIKKSQKGIRTV